jgi:hypothetical protein
MQDPRWSTLKQILIESGWVWRDDTLYAPHETMWFTTSSDEPNMAHFRDRMSEVAEAAANHADIDIDHAALHEDLCSLVAALDLILEGN